MPRALRLDPRQPRALVAGALGLVALVAAGGPAAAQELPFAIRIVDEDGGAPVPCATIRTVHQLRLTSDANGIIAFYEPGLLGRDVWFGTDGPPWELAADWLGFAGVTLPTSAGGEATLRVRRTGTPAPCSPGDGNTRLVEEGLPPVGERHGVRVVDAETGRGVPLAELRLGNRVWVTDSAGLVAFVEPDLLGLRVPFDVTSHGFRPEGMRPDLVRGGRSTIALTRQMPSERLHRVTGAGIYRDSVLLGESTPLAEPLLAAQVAGQDSVHTALHRGRLFWVWGDTLRPSYPLGHFQTAAATSLSPGAGGLDPAVGVDLTYFVGEDGFSRGVADVAEDGLVWTSGLVSIPGAEGGADVLIGSFANVGAGWERLGAGLLRWDDAAERFDVLVEWPDPLPAEPTGTAFVERGYVYFADIGGDGGQGAPYRVVRVPATLDALADPSTYETFTAHGPDGVVLRDDLRLDYAFRAASPPVTRATEVSDDQRIGNQVRSAVDGRAVEDHIGSVFWNDHLGRYLRISARAFGDDAFLGETWAAAADTPMGPYAWAVQVATHADMSFYNPRQHPEFDADGGRTVFFEGTYSSTFAGGEPTPRYDYNQIMHRLDLGAIALPVPVYGNAMRLRAAMRRGDDVLRPRFFALDRPAPGAVALRWSGPDCAPRSLGPDRAGEIAFFAMGGSDPENVLVPLYLVRSGGSDVPAFVPPPGVSPVGWVWPSPIDVAFPVGDHPGPVRADAGPDLCVEGRSAELVGGADPGTTGVWTDEDGVVLGGPAIEVEVDGGVRVLTWTVTDAAGRVGRDVVMVGPVEGAGCACAAGGSAGGLAVVGALLVGVARRRR